MDRNRRIAEPSWRALRSIVPPSAKRRRDATAGFVTAKLRHCFCASSGEVNEGSTSVLKVPRQTNQTAVHRSLCVATGGNRRLEVW
jgi:hypothetical protein